MVFPYLVNGERRFVQVVMSGAVSGRDIALTVEAVCADPDWRPGFDIIWSCAGISDLFFERADVEALVSARNGLADTAGPGRDVIIVKRILDDGMARMYAAMRKNDRRRTYLCASERTALEILTRSRDADSA